MSSSCLHLKLCLAISVAFATLGGGCDELKARRSVQKANKLFYEGRYSKAADLYDEALSLAPELVIGHHNAAINYYKLFVPGDETEENRGVAERAALHFQKYLEHDAEDIKVLGLLTNLWVDSGQFEMALSYWQKELEESPQNRTVILRLADISRQAGRHEDALEYLYQRVSIEASDEARVQAYLDIAKLQWSRLNKPQIVDSERIAIADRGIAALQEAAEIAPDDLDVQSYLGSLYQLRSLSHGASWARYVDAASQRHHQLRRNEIAEAAKAAAAGAGSAPGEKE